MIKDYLDRDIYNLIIKNFSFEDITEIRMRINSPIIIVVKNKKFYLNGEESQHIIATKAIIHNFIMRATENSLYAVNDSIVQGYITLPKGVRVGISGYVVKENETVTTIKNFQAVNIRIPHIVKNCSLPAFEYLVNGEIYNTLIISSPGSGKTTFLRDLIYQLCKQKTATNILIADERNEICSLVEGEPLLDLGCFCDIYTNCSKKYAFKNGIRSMRPDVIFTDEIDLDNDTNSIVEAINSGVKVVASIHAKDLSQLKQKDAFNKVLNNKLFSRYVILTSDEGPGTITHIYDENLHVIYCRCV